MAEFIILKLNAFNFTFYLEGSFVFKKTKYIFVYICLPLM